MKSNKIILTFLISLLCLCGCTNKTEIPSQVFVTFKNYDDSVLYHEHIEYGAIPNYNGSVPYKEETIDKCFNFSGWDKDISIPVYENTIYYAQFTSYPRKYLVSFKNYDGSLIKKVNVSYGEYAVYNDKEPSRFSDNERFDYTFIGWDKELSKTPIYSDTSFIAKYEMNEYVFAYFYNDNKTLLKREKVKTGEIPIYTGSTPYKEYASNDKVYRFKGWDKNLMPLNDDQIYFAQFILLNVYTVTFTNYDGTILGTEKVVEGDTAIYDGHTPSRSSFTSGDYIYTYTFIGWSPSIENVKSDLVVIAQFKSSSKATGATAIKNHLDEYGSGSYNNVETDRSDGISTLGYSGSYFYMGYSNVSSLESYMAVSCGYQATSGTGMFQLYEENTLMFSASYLVYFSNHRYSSISCQSISVCKYYTDDQLALIAALTVLAAKFAVNNAADYLARWDLSYIV